MEPLRVLSYLAPSIPEDFFELVAQSLQARLGVPVRLAFETRVSGPAPQADPFAGDLADLAFVCAPSYPLLKNAGSPVELLPVAPVFLDPRAEDRPVYFADVVVRAEHHARAFPDLRGAVWSYNDRYSRSGWQNMLARLSELGHFAGPDSFFRELVQAGSHLRSLALVAEGRADAAAIDSNTLWIVQRRNPDLARPLRVIESWGPMPIQPLLARAGLGDALKDKISRVLLGLHQDPDLRASLEHSGVRRFAPVEESAYEGIRALGIPDAARDLSPADGSRDGDGIRGNPSLWRGRAIGLREPMAENFEERRFARWICRSCRAARFAKIPPDGRLKCPICYSGESFDPKKHARRDPANRGKRPEHIPPEPL